ncbi:hypothetical protein K431DRAFT_282757 [Polychaeton citri CBS 116435]|uniref:DUF1308 domain-containing protein n=1 Tax=Polychaeton citri CBS 116435 TaxID=1314669 RepID=A0A9P4USH3_9PEZI|nr:hypothetical protein K431DRAFT_282757 [Polychaeton citri CBS 116435]
MESAPGVSELLIRARNLLSELEEFRIHLKNVRLEHSIELSHFRGTVRSELQMLERLSQKPSGEPRDHVARSSNLPFLETVWANCKTSKDVVALQKRVFYGGSIKPEANRNWSGRRTRKENATLVDIISDGGRSWSKVSLLTNTRLLFDLAKQGWEMGASDDEENDRSATDQDDDDDDIPLLKTAKELARAASGHRIRTKQPDVRLILPRVIEGDTLEIDKVLADCRALGVRLICSEELRSIPPIAEAAPVMAPDPISSFSSTLNIDCTILLALVSEFAHAKVSKEPWFHTALQRQVEIEGHENLLPSLLYPVMGNRGLVCTEEAAKRMREIVATIGTISEKARTAILFGEDEHSGKPHRELIDDMQQWSAYDVPASWQLPISIVPANENDCFANLPPEAEIVCKEMTSINSSVFLHGWASRRTTITSNRMKNKQIENGLEKFEDLDESVWPSIWLCPTARSLVGKETRHEKSQKANGRRKSATGSMRLPDPLIRESERRNGLDVLELQEGHSVEDRRPAGYPCEEVLAAKNASVR